MTGESRQALPVYLFRITPSTGATPQHPSEIGCVFIWELLKAGQVRTEVMQQQTFNQENIPFAVSQLRADKQTPALSKHFDGGQCRVFKVDFSDGESWAVRVPLFLHHASRDTVVYLIESEARILEELEKKDFWWAAKIRGCSFTFDNAVGYPFIALTWISGNQLLWSDDFPARHLRDKVLKQVAVIHTALIECTEGTGISNSSFIQRHLAYYFRRHCHRPFYQNNTEQSPPNSRGPSSRDHRTGLSRPNGDSL